MAKKKVVKKIVNGVDVDKLTKMIGDIKEDSELAKFTFRANTDWINGAHSTTTIQGFYGCGEEDVSRDEPFEIEGDEPEILLGNNHGPNAVEMILHSLASCLVVGFIYNAAARGIKVDSLQVDLEGDLDLRGFLGLSEDIQTRPGYQNIRANCIVESDAPREKIEELCEYVQRTSPVLDIIRNPVDVTINLEE